jgi:DNA-binding beta-propeller fold protein YncE
MRERGACQLAAALLALALLAASAEAAPPPGLLVGLPGERGCITELAANGCAFGRAVFGRDLVVSADGRNVYFGSADAVSVFARARRSGALTQLPGSQGCAGWRATEVVEGPCTTARGLIGLTEIDVSPDGRFLYAVAEDSRSLAVFARSAVTGSLRQLPGRRGCLRRPGAGGWRVRACGRARALGSAMDVIVSPGGRVVYVASVDPSRIAVFRRNRETGALRQLRGRAGCVSRRGRGRCTPARTLGEPLGLAASHDGRSLYVASSASDAVTVLRRMTSGALRERAGRAGCLSTPEDAESEHPCTPVRELGGPTSVAVSSDDRTLYTGGTSSLLSIRQSGERLTQLPGRSGCIGFASDCTDPHVPLGVESVVLSPDGRNLYAGTGSNTVLAVRRRGDGSLRPFPGRAGCLARGRVARCVQTRGLTRPLGLAVSPDGRNVYVAAFSVHSGAGGMAVLRRRR